MVVRLLCVPACGACPPLFLIVCSCAVAFVPVQRAQVCSCIVSCVRSSLFWPLPVKYAEVRVRVAHAFDEKSFEMFQAIESLQSLSRQTVALIADVEKRCS